MVARGPFKRLLPTGFEPTFGPRQAARVREYSGAMTRHLGNHGKQILVCWDHEMLSRFFLTHLHQPTFDGAPCHVEHIALSLTRV